MLYEYCVIGNGLIGAALALELAQRSKKICVLGAAYGDEGKYYSSHEDDSRIARCWHSDPYWEDLARRNFKKLEALAAATDIKIFRQTPVLYRYASGFKPATDSVRHRDCKSREEPAPCFDFEDVYGGIIEPKLYIASLNQAAQKLGTDFVHCVVHQVGCKGGTSVINTSAGAFESRRVVDVRGILFRQNGFEILA